VIPAPFFLFSILFTVTPPEYPEMASIAPRLPWLHCPWHPG